MHYYLLFLASILISINISAQTDTLQTSSTPKEFKNTLAIGANIIHLGIDNQISKEFGAEYSRKTGIGVCIGHLNYMERFGNKGIQLQAECYPKLWKKAYAHFVFGYSGSNAYPQIATGFTLIQALKGGFEAELGARFYQSGDKQNVYALILGANKYLGRSLIMYKLWLVKTPTQNQQAHNLQWRYYAKDEKSYVFAGLSVGNATRLDNSGQFAFDTANDINLSLQAGLNKHFAKRYNLSTSAFYDRTKYANQNTQQRVGASVRMAVSF